MKMALKRYEIAFCLSLNCTSTTTSNFKVMTLSSFNAFITTVTLKVFCESIQFISDHFGCFQYAFGSFISRDNTYKFLVSVWKKSQETKSGVSRKQSELKFGIGSQTFSKKIFSNVQDFTVQVPRL